jgi:fused-like protein
VENLSFKGSPLYMAPEIVDNKEGNSKIDVFSLGCVVYQLAYDGNQPFYSETKKYRSMYDYF